jgi:TatD DNase family protein
LNLIDIHTHTLQPGSGHVQLVNVFPGEEAVLSHPGLFSAGLHPWHITAENRQQAMDRVRESAQLEQVIAIGETGLDKTVAVPLELQEQVFSAHIRLAVALRKPLIIHCVQAYSEMLAFRKKSDLSLPWIFHWFNSGEQTARELIRKNCYLSYGVSLFRPGSKAFRAFPALPASNLFMETDDAGYSLKEVYEKAAAMRDISLESWIQTMKDNFRQCFGREV